MFAQSNLFHFKHHFHKVLILANIKRIIIFYPSPPQYFGIDSTLKYYTFSQALHTMLLWDMSQIHQTCDHGTQALVLKLSSCS